MQYSAITRPVNPEKTITDTLLQNIPSCLMQDFFHGRKKFLLFHRSICKRIHRYFFDCMYTALFFNYFAKSSPDDLLKSAAGQVLNTESIEKARGNSGKDGGKNMLNTTLGYIERDGSYLMLHRNKKAGDINHDKWIGIGGKLEEGESVLSCMKRECREETGLHWHDPTLRGVITFNYRKHPEDPLFSELMFLFTGSAVSGSMKECNEGTLEWVAKDQIRTLPLWKGDKIFFYYLDHDPNLFFMRLDYLGDTLIYASHNGHVLSLDDPRFQ